VKLVEFAICRDQSSVLGYLLDNCISANASIRGSALLVVAKAYFARECFGLLLQRGAIPYNNYWYQYSPGGAIDSFEREYDRIDEEVDREFFHNRGERTAFWFNQHFSARFLRTVKFDE